MDGARAGYSWGWRGDLQGAAKANAEEGFGIDKAFVAAIDKQAESFQEIMANERFRDISEDDIPSVLMMAELKCDQLSAISRDGGFVCCLKLDCGIWRSKLGGRSWPESDLGSGVDDTIFA